MDGFLGPGRSRGAFQVVVVNGDISARGLMVDQLSEMTDIEVVGVAGTVTEAVEIVRSCRADVVVTEATLPDGAGDEICRRLRAENTHRCGCVVLSGLPRRPGADAAPGVDAFVLKELVGGTLESEIRRVASTVRSRVSR